jgi:hypothetical protein
VELLLGGNALEALPEGVSQLAALRVLELRGNRCKFISPYPLLPGKQIRGLPSGCRVSAGS